MLSVAVVGRNRELFSSALQELLADLLPGAAGDWANNSATSWGGHILPQIPGGKYLVKKTLNALLQ